MNFTDYTFEKSKDLNKTAVIDNGEISYSEIYERVYSIACLLQYKNYSKEDSVLVISENSAFFIETYFGIIKSGSICVPVNPSMDKKDIAYIAKILNTKLIFCQYKYKNEIKDCLGENIEICTERDICEKQSNVKLKIDADMKEDTALIMFTSGSTSKPKGVMLTHYNLIYNTDSIIQYLNLTDKDRIEVVLPFYYCYGTSLLNTHFRCGGSLVINNRFMFPQTVIDDINKYKCTGFAGVPTTYQILLRMTNLNDSRFSSLRYVTQAGGKLPKIFISELYKILKGVDIYIMYGQTEATARLSYLPPQHIIDKLGSIGKGIPGTELMILNKDGVPVNTGEIGEIAARGANIMKGYFDDEDETNKVIKNGLLYTGDIAYKDKDGYIFIVSREKNIIKCAGNRISSGEIENAIASIKQVVECAVIGVEDEMLGEAVKAFVVLNGRYKDIDEKYIINYCSSRLPKYKTPKYIKFLPSLPKNSSGKVLFKQLKTM